jgi:hypothetical protein
MPVAGVVVGEEHVDGATSRMTEALAAAGMRVVLDVGEAA